MRVGFFDSGLGGLTVLKEAINNHGLKGDIWYLGDTLNTPYGTKRTSFVKEIIHENINYLVENGCNPIVIACNTATALCVKELREKYKDITIIGTEPAVKVAADANEDKRIMVLATTITVSQEKLHNLVDVLDISEKVDMLAADQLVKFAEHENCNNLNDEVDKYIEELISDYDMNEFSHIVLGCTHFPLFRQNFERIVKKLYPNSDVKVIDGARGISENLMKNIQKIDASNPTATSITVVTTNVNKTFERRAAQILEKDDLNFVYKLQ